MMRIFSYTLFFLLIFFKAEASFEGDIQDLSLSSSIIPVDEQQQNEKKPAIQLSDVEDVVEPLGESKPAPVLK